MQLEFLPFAQEQNVPRGTQIEEWRSIPDFIRYEASSFGRFRNKATGKFLTGKIVHNNYQNIGLIRDGKQFTLLAHRVIASTFLEKPSPLHNQVNHKNKIRGDNHISNLEWLTQSQNAKHAMANRSG